METAKLQEIVNLLESNGFRVRSAREMVESQFFDGAIELIATPKKEASQPCQNQGN